MNKQELESIIHRIDKEIPNFQHISQNAPYKSDLHKKAVEVYSFESLEKEILKLQTIKKFKKNSEQILATLKSKNTFKLLDQLNQLKPELIKYSKKLDIHANEEIINLRPNFYGIGVNLKALWRKITNQNL
ncbi:MAG: hypothetical protein ABIC04_06980 [Nanoarchaeota archaeon]